MGLRRGRRGPGLKGKSHVCPVAGEEHRQQWTGAEALVPLKSMFPGGAGALWRGGRGAGAGKEGSRALCGLLRAVSPGLQSGWGGKCVCVSLTLKCRGKEGKGNGGHYYLAPQLVTHCPTSSLSF